MKRGTRSARGPRSPLDAGGMVMKKRTPTPQLLVAENEDLRARLAEAEETLRAIRQGEVDALVVSTEQGERVFTREGAEHPYRVLIEQMNEGAVTLSAQGVILYCNHRFAEMLRTPLEKVIGSSLQVWVAPADREAFQSLWRPSGQQSRRGEITLRAGDGTLTPAYLSVNPLLREEAPGVLCLVALDLTEQKRSEAIVAAEQLARSILEQAVAAIVVCDETGRIIRASEAAHALCGEKCAKRFGLAGDDFGIGEFAARLDGRVAQDLA